MDLQHLIAGLAGARVVYMPMNLQTTAAELQSNLAHAISPRTKLAILNTPNNPTGQVWTAEQLQRLADAAQAYDFIVLADEIYEKILYDGAQHISIASLPGMWERTLILNGLSKSHAMTGWRLGYIAGPEPLIAELLKSPPAFHHLRDLFRAGSGCGRAQRPAGIHRIHGKPLQSPP